ncbi:MAG TPA: PepSY-like domain-containing protein [Candidatus Phocaeicola excrementigallinarum]|mgnify:CR=1 FL=1|nr:PepSY-like domain-containing protein [Candidatus Phocaeicola excrementigallinarum]
MKKLVVLLVSVFAMSTVVMADNDKPIQIGQLPTKAQTFISTYFKNAKIALAKQETELFDKSYDVIFTNGEKLEFDKSGDWTEVSCKINGVPAAIIPQAIRTYVETNYPDAKVLKIERDRHEYEVKLSNRWEITFDNQMRVIDIDD